MKTMDMFVLLLAVVVLTACARQQVIIDPAGVDMAKYDQDLATCNQIAEQVDQKAGQGALAGAVISGTIGAILGDSRDAKKWAGVGAVTGGARGAQQTQQEKDQVIKNCLRNRGYKVLN